MVHARSPRHTADNRQWPVAHGVGHSVYSREQSLTAHWFANVGVASRLEALDDLFIEHRSG
jgi:hypothetical protein